MLYLKYQKNCIFLALHGSLQGAPNWSTIVGAGLLGAYLDYWGWRMTFPDGWRGIVLSGIIYTFVAWVAVVLFRLIVIAPYRLWLDGGYKPGKSVAEITAIINALDKAHTTVVALIADITPDSDYHSHARAEWTMNTMRAMEQLGVREHEIFSFQNPAGLPDQDKCLRERQQLLRSLIEQYMREKQCQAGK